MRESETMWLFRKYMSLNHIQSLNELSDLCGIGYQTLRARVQHIQRIRIFELIAIDNVLHFNDDDYLLLSRGMQTKKA